MILVRITWKSGRSSGFHCVHREGREEKKEEDLSGGRGPEGGMEGKGRGKESDADGERKEKRACGS